MRVQNNKIESKESNENKGLDKVNKNIKKETFNRGQLLSSENSIESINHELLIDCLTTSTNELFEELEICTHIKLDNYSSFNDKRHLHFISKSNGYKVLLVCHIDTVTSLSKLNELFYDKSTSVLHAKGLDNRLGLFTCLILLIQYPQHFDLLVCDHEEKGLSTSQFFSCPSHYNYIVEFDRMNTNDVVLYHSSKSLARDIEANTTHIESYGSYSDIYDIETDIASVNWSICFRDYHSVNSHVVIDEYIESINQFRKFFIWTLENNKSYKLDQVYSSDSFYDFDDDDDDYSYPLSTTSENKTDKKQVLESKYRYSYETWINTYDKWSIGQDMSLIDYDVLDEYFDYLDNTNSSIYDF